ncbi:MAG: hydroxypyruvate isomerase [Verrucomicrobia bacterium GWF2_62_7]|nr:MAG: hydroxypyruvate isomerase [Verrucomicrobia bacterium GWF2_62_7]
MNKSTKITRRSAITAIAAAAGSLAGARLATAAENATPKLKGSIRHSVSKWCYGKIPLDEFCRAVKEMGIESVELLGQKDWETVQKHGLTCAMCNGPAGWSIPKGWNRVENHDKLVAAYEQMIPIVANAGLPNLICFSGNRDGLDDQKGMENCVTGLKRLMKLAEEKKVTIVMELLNSKRNHKDYQCDHTAWGVEVCKRVGSERMKLLYDIYHMQIMEGDVIATIKEFHPYFAHYHTGGVPGRNEIDETQELNYATICRAIVATGYKGFVGQEFIPKRDPLTSLRQSIHICDV